MLQLSTPTNGKATMSPPILNKTPRKAGGASASKVRSSSLASIIARYETADAALRKAEDHSERLRGVHSVPFLEFDEAKAKDLPAPLRAARTAQKRVSAVYNAARKAVISYRPTSPADAAALLQFVVLSDFQRDDEAIRTATNNAVTAIRQPISEGEGGVDSETIRQCVKYVQAIAAHDAGFTVDGTGDFEHASANRHLGNSRRAMMRLIAISPHATAGTSPLTALELYAKAGVLAAMYGLRSGAEPDGTEIAFIRFFAGEVRDFFAQQI